MKSRNERLTHVLRTVKALFDTALRPGDPTGMGSNQYFLRFASDIRKAYPHGPTQMAADAQGYALVTENVRMSQALSDLIIDEHVPLNENSRLDDLIAYLNDPDAYILKHTPVRPRQQVQAPRNLWPDDPPRRPR
jgi:hypothetical protein